MIWSFRLEGNDFDIQAVRQLFKDSVTFSVDTECNNLVMIFPFEPAEVGAAIEAAEELLSKLNGIAQAIHGNHEKITIGSVFSQETRSAPLHRYLVSRSPGKLRLRGGTPSVTLSGTASPQSEKVVGDLFLEAADRDEHFNRAIYLYGSLTENWRGLYMVLEAAEDGNGGEQGLIAKQWAPRGAIKKFKDTANSFKAIRLEARHGSVKSGIGKPTQTIEDARMMIRTIVERWGMELSRTR